MPNCPNCSYGLVLREYSRKYKCAKCGKVFPQSEIDLKEFHEFNNKEKQREKEEADKIKEEADKEYRKAYNEEHKEEKKKYFKDYYQENKEKLKAKQKEWSKNNPNKVKEYKRKSREAQAKMREENPGYNSENCKIYYGKNKDKVLAQQREYRKKSEQAIKDRRKSKRMQNIEEARVMDLIKYSRNRQKQITLLMLKNEVINPYKVQFKSILPTF